MGLTFLVTTFDGLQRIFGTVDLDGGQWGVCALVALAFLVLAELGKLVLRQVDRHRGTPADPGAPARVSPAQV
ncbi:cation transporting ATPase C-terminal domain-containing protein [Cellulosimicrobium cellulans]|nr:cation transporting ATPase C-terminal domain-containing protein [Cellulosimicrobium cellulans]